MFIFFSYLRVSDEGRGPEVSVLLGRRVLIVVSSAYDAANFVLKLLRMKWMIHGRLYSAHEKLVIITLTLLLAML